VQAARSAALAELQELKEAYAELQQQHGTLQVSLLLHSAPALSLWLVPHCMMCGSLG
jgi:hypothetical protein